MRQKGLTILATACLTASAALAGCGGGSRTNDSANGSVATPAGSAPTTDTAATAAPDHHSKLAGAAVGAVAGHVLGGHAVAGAAAGALIQHERNKHGH